MSILSISNHTYSASISLQGAQITSLRHKTSDTELIWQRDKNYWADSAPNLFPIVCMLKDQSLNVDGETYSMPKHGVLRHEPFTVIEHASDLITLSHKATDKSRKAYPFNFEYQITFRLIETGLETIVTIINNDNNEMPYSLGFHPAFNLDLDNFSHKDYHIQFPDAVTLDLCGVGKDGFFIHREKNYLNETDKLPLSLNIFDYDALIFKNVPFNAVKLVRSDGWSMNFHTGGAPNFAIWAAPKAPFACLEPWWTLPDANDEDYDDIRDKAGIMSLKPCEKKSFQLFYGLAQS